MKTECQVQAWTPWSQSEVEVLGDFVGWIRVGGPWNPFLDARHDLQVLERVREVWGDQVRWRFACELHRVWTARVTETVAYAVLNLTKYECGDYSRAALAVLKEMEAEG